MEQIQVVDNSWPCIQQNIPVDTAIAVMNKKEIDYLPVVSGDKLVGELRVSAKVRTTLMDIRTAEVRRIMTKPLLVLTQQEDWSSWAKTVMDMVPVVDSTGNYLGITSPELINEGFRKMLQFHLERFQAVLDCTHNGIMAIDSMGQLTIFNRAASKFLQLAPETVLGKPVETLFPQTGLLEVLKTGKAQYSKQISHSGKIFISNRTPIIANGQTLGAVAVFQDISELTRVSQQLEIVQQLNKELDAMIHCSHDGICITDKQAVIIRLNPSFQRVTGLDEKEYLGKNINQLLAAGVMDQSPTLKVLETGNPATLMQTFATGKQAISTAYPVYNQQKEITRVVTNIRDVTELNLLKEELEKSKLLTTRYLTQLAQLKKENNAVSHQLISVSDVMNNVIDLAHRVAGVDTTVLLLGESGVGKENIAQLIHQNSQRSEGAFIKLNCGAIPKELLESELFGYESGAFTGAKREGKLGYFQLADQGTLFLDEIADLPLELQVKLLRVLQEQEIVRLGGEKPIKIDVRIIAATNKNLEEMMVAGEFRSDLYYRLHVVPIKIPPLRQRSEDIAPLLIYYTKKLNDKYQMQKVLTNDTIEILEQYSWPGNVRELVNLVERLLVISPTDKIAPDQLPSQIRKLKKEKIMANNDETLAPEVNLLYDETSTLQEVLDEVEEEIVAQALARSKNYQDAAKILGISIATLNRRIEKHQLHSRKTKNNINNDTTYHT